VERSVLSGVARKTDERAVKRREEHETYNQAGRQKYVRPVALVIHT